MTRRFSTSPARSGASVRLRRDSIERRLRTTSESNRRFSISCSLGEAVKRLSVEFRERHSDVPWSRIAGMRDRIIHGYDSVDLDEVWNAVTIHVPELAARLEPLMPRKG